VDVVDGQDDAVAARTRRLLGLGFRLLRLGDAHEAAPAVAALPR
jgi:hypothetical protein